MSKSIFYSWQSDLPNNHNRSLIENSIGQAIKHLKNSFSLDIDFICDRDTKAVSGSPDIVQTIFDKIDKAEYFVCDVSIISAKRTKKKTSNPNVLIELGYAIKSLGWDRILCIFNSDYGKIENLPFDIRQKRVLKYSGFTQKPFENRKIISSAIMEDLKQLHAKGLFYNPLNDYLKGKIDECFIDIGGNLGNLLLGGYSMTEAFENFPKLLRFNEIELNGYIQSSNFLGFFFYNNYEKSLQSLEAIFNKIISSNFFPSEWATMVLSLIQWINENTYIVSERTVPPIAQKTDTGENCHFQFLPASKMAPDNPPNSYILLKPLDDGSGSMVLNTSEFILAYKVDIPCFHKFNREQYPLIQKHIEIFRELCKDWLRLTNNEFILPQKSFRIKPADKVKTSVHFI